VNDSEPWVKNEYSCATFPEACEGISEEAALCECLAEELWIVDCLSVSGNGVTGIFVELVAL